MTNYIGILDGGGKAYGVDVLIPTNYDKEAEASTEAVIDLIPGEQKGFVDKLLDAKAYEALVASEKH